MKYFAYGSNMNLKRMEQRKIRFSRREHAILDGWRLEFNKIASRNPNEGYANIMRDKKCVVEGILYECPDSNMKNLDKYEGCPNHYYKDTVKVKLDDGQEVEAITYIANPDKIESGLKPSKEYLNHLLKGCDLLPKEYCERLGQRETLD